MYVLKDLTCVPFGFVFLGTSAPASPDDSIKDVCDISSLHNFFFRVHALNLKTPCCCTFQFARKTKMLGNLLDSERGLS